MYSRFAFSTEDFVVRLRLGAAINLVLSGNGDFAVIALEIAGNVEIIEMVFDAIGNFTKQRFIHEMFC
jgi:hypothetical protein